MKKKPVAQEDLNGCGVACIAFVANKTYEEIRELVDDYKIVTAQLYCYDIQIILEKLGLKYYYCTTEKNFLPNITITDNGMNELCKANNAIVFIPPSPDDPVGHFLVGYQGKFMDPWINRHNRCNLSAKAGFIDKLPRSPTWLLIPSHKP